MKYIADNTIRSVLEEKTPKKLVGIDRPLVDYALKTPNGDLMVLVYESLEELMGNVPDQNMANTLTPITNETLYAVMVKGDRKHGNIFDYYLLFSTKRDWLDLYVKVSDPSERLEVIKIDDFSKIKNNTEDPSDYQK